MGINYPISTSDRRISEPSTVSPPCCCSPNNCSCRPYQPSGLKRRCQSHLQLQELPNHASTVALPGNLFKASKVSQTRWDYYCCYWLLVVGCCLLVAGCCLLLMLFFLMMMLLSVVVLQTFSLPKTVTCQISAKIHSFSDALVDLGCHPHVGDAARENENRSIFLESLHINHPKTTFIFKTRAAIPSSFLKLKVLYMKIHCCSSYNISFFKCRTHRCQYDLKEKTSGLYRIVVLPRGPKQFSGIDKKVTF